MASLADFRTLFTAFSGVTDAKIIGYLEAAALEIDKCVWGGYASDGGGGPLKKADWGQMYLAAHKLSVDPQGQNAKTIVRPQQPFEKNQHPWSRTTYGNEYFLLMRGVSAGGRVT